MKTFKTYAQRRTEIKRLLSLLEDSNREVFNRMYSSPVDITQDVNVTVDRMPAKQLSWALTQCQNSYHEIFRILKRA
jgi:hypothetical protein